MVAANDASSRDERIDELLAAGHLKRSRRPENTRE
jgi:hypothetical protein